MAKINGSIISKYEIKKIKNLDFISKNLQRKNSYLQEKTMLSIPTICRYKKIIKDNMQGSKIEVNIRHKNFNNQNAKIIENDFTKDLFVKYQIENQKINSNVTKKFITVKDFYEDLSEEIKSKISLLYLYNAWLKHGFCSPYATHKIKRIAKNIFQIWKLMTAKLAIVKN